ncbi:hypothetical protein ACLB2K_017238 [Fragaria x ananassa]
MPGADFQLVKLLGLNPSINRFMIYQQGCFAGGTVLRIAKDVAENNAGARVLIVCCEITTMFFQQPCDSPKDVLVGQALFSDGAAAFIVGVNPDPKSERQLFNYSSWGSCHSGQSGSEEQLRLKEGNLRAPWHVLSEFGNMGAPCVFFILDEMRKKSGEGLEWGVLIGIGPELTVETVVLRSAATAI